MLGRSLYAILVSWRCIPYTLVNKRMCLSCVAVRKHTLNSQIHVCTGIWMGFCPGIWMRFCPGTYMGVCNHGILLASMIEFCKMPGQTPIYMHLDARAKPHPCAQAKPHPDARAKPHPEARETPHPDARENPHPDARAKPHPDARANPIQVPRQCPGKTSGMTGTHSHSAQEVTPTPHPLSGITSPPFSFAWAYAWANARAKAGTFLKVFDGNTLP